MTHHAPPETRLATASRGNAAVDFDTSDPSSRDYVHALVTKYGASLHRYLTRLVQLEDSSALVQEAYSRLLRDGDIVRLESMARASLFHTATDLARDLERRQKVHRMDQRVKLNHQDLVQGHLGPDVPLAGEQTLAAIERAIEDLPSDMRTMFLLHRFRNMSYSQIAQTMNLGKRIVMRKMADALARLGSAVESVM